MTDNDRADMSNCDLLSRAAADLIAVERRLGLGNGGKLTEIIAALVRYSAEVEDPAHRKERLALEAGVEQLRAEGKVAPIPPKREP